MDKLNLDANLLNEKWEEEKLIWKSQKIGTIGTLNSYSF
jgi:hypothetical protein